MYVPLKPRVYTAHVESVVARIQSAGLRAGLHPILTNGTHILFRIHDFNGRGRVNLLARRTNWHTVPDTLGSCGCHLSWSERV